VNYIQGDHASKFYRVSDGTLAIKKITRRIKVGDDSFEPSNPCPYPYKSLLDEILDSENSVQFGFASESQKAGNGSKAETEGS
jgi:hypothetical protein